MTDTVWCMIGTVRYMIENGVVFLVCFMYGMVWCIIDMQQCMIDKVYDSFELVYDWYGVVWLVWNGMISIV